MSRSKDIIDILIPAYNSESFIEETLKSVLKNESSLYDLNIVVLNNNSTDNTLNILKKYDNKIIIHSNTYTLNIADNWSKLTNFSIGSYSILICADDLILPGSIEAKYKILKLNPDLVFVFSKRGIISSKNRIIKRKISNNLKSGIYNKEQISKIILSKGTNVIGEPFSVMFESNALKNSLPWDDEYPYLIDLSMYMKSMHEQSQIYHLDEIHGYFRVHKNSLSSRLKKQQSRQFYDYVVKNLIKSEKISKKIKIKIRLLSKMNEIKRFIFYLYLKLVDRN